MRVFVLTNEAGNVVATAPVEPWIQGDAPSGGRIVPDPGYEVHEADIPEELYTGLRNVDDFHDAVARHMRTGSA